MVAVGGEWISTRRPSSSGRWRALLKKGATQLVVDFTLATFIDSTALHVLLRAARQLNGKEGELVVVAPDPNVCKVFEITGLNRLFAVESSLSTVSVPS